MTVSMETRAGFFSGGKNTRTSPPATGALLQPCRSRSSGGLALGGVVVERRLAGPVELQSIGDWEGVQDVGLLAQATRGKVSRPSPSSLGLTRGRGHPHQDLLS